MAKNTSGNVKLIGKITTKNLVYDFSDSVNYKIVFLNEERTLEGKYLFSFEDKEKYVLSDNLKSGK